MFGKLYRAWHEHFFARSSGDYSFIGLIGATLELILTGKNEELDNME